MEPRVVACAYFLHSAATFFLLGVIIIEIILGRSPVLSRSLHGSIVPEEASAEFYGFYYLFSKSSAIWRPLVFAVIRELSGSVQLSLRMLFIVGLVLLGFVDEEKAREAKFQRAL